MDEGQKKNDDMPLDGLAGYGNHESGSSLSKIESETVHRPPNQSRPAGAYATNRLAPDPTKTWPSLGRALGDSRRRLCLSGGGVCPGGVLPLALPALPSEPPGCILFCSNLYTASLLRLSLRLCITLHHLLPQLDFAVCLLRSRNMPAPLAKGT